MRPGRHLAVAMRSSTKTGAIDKLLLLQEESEMQFGHNVRSAAFWFGIVLQIEIECNVTQI